nr:DUF4391 domain-containing protein [Geosporobacter subterraneus]
MATDCISEGQNLQDCDYLVNYDIHWNPVRIIQRFRRIDRIGSRNAPIQLVNFWLDLTLDDYINLKSRVETRMKISVMTSTGGDLKDAVARDERRQKLQKEIAVLENKVRREKQFNIQVALNGELKRLRKELEGLSSSQGYEVE